MPNTLKYDLNSDTATQNMTAAMLFVEDIASKKAQIEAKLIAAGENAQMKE